MRCLFQTRLTMKKTIPFLLIVWLTGLLVSCHKEPEASITFGNTKGMRIENYDTLVGLGKTMVLDVDADGTDDLKLVSYFDGPLSIGEKQTLHLDCLNENVALLGDLLEAERYTHYDTIIDFNEHLFSDRPIVLYYTKHNICEKISENDEVHISIQFTLSANNVNDPFSIDNHFESQRINLFKENLVGGPNDNIYESNDTLYVWNSDYYFDCDNFPTNTEKYIGFKITKDGKPRLGWLKLNLIGDETVNVHLIETAIQE